MSRLWVVITVVLLIIVLPIGSWYYLKSGFDFQKESYDKLEGQIGVLDLESLGKQMRMIPADQKGKVGIVAFVFDNAEADSIITNLQAVHQQFDSRDDVSLICFVARPDTASLGTDEDLMALYGLTDYQQWTINQGDRELVEDLSMEHFSFPASRLGESTLMLIDPMGAIKRVYDPFNKDEIQELIRHITVVLPRGPNKDIGIRREKEK